MQTVATNNPGTEASLSVVAPPDRRPCSLRRTSSMQSFWPGGVSGTITVVATARDLYTGQTGEPHVVAQRRAEIALTQDKRIARIDADYPQAALAGLTGLRPGGALRKAMGADMPDEVAQTTLLYRLLDDLGGTSFMAGAAWFRWLPGVVEEFEAANSTPAQMRRTVEGVCISFQPGSIAMTEDGRTNHALSSHPDAPLPFRSDDPSAWHAFADRGGPNHWRIRYTDVWFEDGILRVSAGFQDSAALPQRTDRRVLFHEYCLDATVDPASFVLRDIHVRPGSLPFATCLAAPATAKALEGRQMDGFGDLVPVLLAGTGGCTHLNEVLRALRDVPAMATALSAEMRRRTLSDGPTSSKGQ